MHVQVKLHITAKPLPTLSLPISAHLSSTQAHPCLVVVIPAASPHVMVYRSKRPR